MLRLEVVNARPHWSELVCNLKELDTSIKRWKYTLTNVLATQGHPTILLIPETLDCRSKWKQTALRRWRWKVLLYMTLTFARFFMPALLITRKAMVSHVFPNSDSRLPHMIGPVISSPLSWGQDYSRSISKTLMRIPLDLRPSRCGHLTQV